MLRIVEGSILDFEGDAIVNAANSFLNHGGGLARIIDLHARGDQSRALHLGDPMPDTSGRVERYMQDHAAAPLIATGNAHVTSAGLLPYKGIIHAVGPIYNGGGFCERVLLRSAYAEACAQALDHRWERIAFPVLSVGIFGYPINLAATVAALELRHWESFSGLDISVYVFDPNPERHAAILGALKEATR